MGSVPEQYCRPSSVPSAIAGMNVSTLGDHLGAHQDVGAVGREIVYYAIIAVLAARGVQIHAGNLLAREDGVDVVLDALGSVANNL